MESIGLPWTALPLTPGALLGPLTGSTQLSTLAAVLTLHTLLCLLAAVICLSWLPAPLQRPRWAALLLLFNFSFIAPVLGPVAIALISRSSRQLARQAARQAQPVSIALPEYDVQAADTHVRSSQGAIRSRLEPQVPSHIRMQSLLTLQAVPGRVANPILETLLGDDSDDVRLLAFGMLDSEEKHISRSIQRERAQLETELDVEQRYDCLRQLAELHWELVYACLAQGELRRHILRQAHDYIAAALATGVPPNPGLLLLQGRVLLAQEDYEASEQVFHQAIQTGLPPVSALPYLAEIAYARRDFARVHKHLEQLAPLNTAAKTTAVVNLWMGRETLGKLSDYNFLPHL